MPPRFFLKFSAVERYKHNYKGFLKAVQEILKKSGQFPVKCCKSVHNLVK